MKSPRYVGAALKKRNPVAKDLKTPKYRPRVVKSKKAYDRKQKQEASDA